MPEINYKKEFEKLANAYEDLLELLPQDSFSKAGTYPEWVADAVENNTLRKGITQDDVAMFIELNDTAEGLIEDLKDYFDLDEEFYEERKAMEELIENLNE